jgi:hypothetical protein
MESFYNAVLTFIKLVIDIVKTIPRFFVKFFVVGIFSYPMLLIAGFVEQIDPNLLPLIEYPFIYLPLAYLSYKDRIEDSAAKRRYREGRTIAEKFNYLYEALGVFRKEYYTLIKDTVAFLILYIPIVLLFYFQRPDMQMALIAIGASFPFADMLVMLLVRRKWFKEYDEFRKEKKTQEFHE